MSAVEALKVTRDRVEAARKGSAAWQLGIPIKPYVWRRDDPERDEKIAAERAESAQKSAAAKARFSHGLHRYNRYGCRCDVCREAKRLENGRRYRLVCTCEMSR